MDSVALWELEDGEELGLGGASEAVVGELGHDGGVQAAPAVHWLHCGVDIGEAEAPPGLTAIPKLPSYWEMWAL